MAQGVWRKRGGFREERNEIECAERFEEQKHAKHESEVADAIDDEGFLTGVGSGFSQEIKTDQQVTAKSHAFPADEEENVIGGQDENEHEEHEEVEVGEKAVVAAFVGHVAGGVDVDQPADSGDYEEHDHGEMVNLEVEAGAEISGDDPGEVLLDPRDIFWSKLREFADSFKRGQEREAGGTDGDGVDELVRPLGAEKAVDRRAEERQRGNNPEIVENRHQSLSKSTVSTFSDLRLREIMMMMPRPTAASAAATTITKRTKTWPSRRCQTWLKATKARLTALSISSMDIKMVMMLRLKMKAMTPSPKRIALRIT